MTKAKGLAVDMVGHGQVTVWYVRLVIGNDLADLAAYCCCRSQSTAVVDVRLPLWWASVPQLFIAYAHVL